MVLIGIDPYPYEHPNFDFSYLVCSGQVSQGFDSIPWRMGMLQELDGMRTLNKYIISMNPSLIGSNMILFGLMKVYLYVAVYCYTTSMDGYEQW